MTALLTAATTRAAAECPRNARLGHVAVVVLAMVVMMMPMGRSATAVAKAGRTVGSGPSGCRECTAIVHYRGRVATKEGRAATAASSLPADASVMGALSCRQLPRAHGPSCAAGAPWYRACYPHRRIPWPIRRRVAVRVILGVHVAGTAWTLVRSRIATGGRCGTRSHDGHRDTGWSRSRRPSRYIAPLGTNRARSKGALLDDRWYRRQSNIHARIRRVRIGRRLGRTVSSEGPHANDVVRQLRSPSTAAGIAVARTTAIPITAAIPVPATIPVAAPAPTAAPAPIRVTTARAAAAAPVKLHLVATTAATS